MKWEQLLSTISDEPIFTSALLMTPDVSPSGIHRQLSRWVKAKKLHQLRRGLYTLAEPHRKTVPEPFLTANYLKRASYVSLQSALAFHGMIPEYVPTVTSVTTGRPEEIDTPLGRFLFRHVKKEFLFGYSKVELVGGQAAFVASPEKSLLDLIYLTSNACEQAYLEELRLQNLEILDVEKLIEMAERSMSPKILKAARRIVQMAEYEEYEIL